MDKGGDLEDALKDQMDFETLRDMVITLIWKDDAAGLRSLCEQQVMLPIFVEKVIDEIASGNPWNDVLCLIARRLIESDPDLEPFAGQLAGKTRFVANPKGGREVLKPLVHEELEPDDFMKKLELIAGTHTYAGLDALVAENPDTTRSFIGQYVAEHGGTLSPDTRLFQLLCEMALAYRNHHHQTDLLDLLQQAGGKLSFLNPPDSVGTIRLFEGADALHQLLGEAKHAREVLQSGDLDAALALYGEVLPKIDTVFAGRLEPGGVLEYANALLFSGVLLALNGEPAAAQQRFMTCMKHRFALGLHAYGSLLLTNVEALRANAAAVRSALTGIPGDVAPHQAFDCFFQRASGHNFSEVNVLYDHFLEAAGDREMDTASELSERLLDMYAARRSSIVPFSFCELLVRIFRACHAVLQGDLPRAEREYTKGWHGELPADKLREGFQRMAGNPEKILSHYFGD